MNWNHLQGNALQQLKDALDMPASGFFDKMMKSHVYKRNFHKMSDCGLGVQRILAQLWFLLPLRVRGVCTAPSV